MNDKHETSQDLPKEDDVFNQSMDYD